MKVISVDFYDSLDCETDLWKKFLKYVKLEGIKVHIISGPWPSYLDERLEFHGYVRGVHYNSSFSILSHLAAKGLDTWHDEDHDSWYAPEDAWWSAKAEICRILRCQIHFDSDIRFAKSFEDIPTRFVYTRNEVGRYLIKDWLNRLELANTYEGWETDYRFVTG